MSFAVFESSNEEHASLTSSLNHDLTIFKPIMIKKENAPERIGQETK